MSITNIEGKKLPEVTFKIRDQHKWLEKKTSDFFKGKKVVLFALPGAFTPTCSSTHLPRYNELTPDFKKLGVDDVICLSVNDSFTMNAWQESQKAFDVTMLPDGNGELTEALGMLVDKKELGFGHRSWRYSMLVNDGVIEKMFIEQEIPGDPFQVSDADTMIKFLDESYEIPKSISVFTRVGCEYCVKAKELLDKKGLKYEEHVLNKDFGIKTLIALSGATKVPQVFINGERIGGADQLEKFLS